MVQEGLDGWVLYGHNQRRKTASFWERSLGLFLIFHSSIVIYVALFVYA